MRLSIAFSLILALASTFGASPIAAGSPRSDATIVRQAAMRLGRTSRESTLAWVRRQPGVVSARTGADGRTLSLHFSDGREAVVLPAVPRVGWSAHLQLRRTLQAAGTPPNGKRALVLEPFATQLDLGRSDGDTVAGELQRAGYTVDVLYDGAVTLATMTTISRYNVVYILSHSGANEYGEGDLATAQEWHDEPAYRQYIDNHTALIVGVMGSDKLYYGILSSFITAYVGQFPPNSLVFLNGCMLLRANLFWQALQNKGVSTMVSWDNDAMAVDDRAAAIDFFSDMAASGSVAHALDFVRSAGAGTSTVALVQAHIGYLGNGALTLADQPSPPTPTPTVTPIPTDTPTPVPATATPTDSVQPTPIHSAPPSLLHVRLRTAVGPGQPQTISVQTDPGEPVHIAVQYPNGERASRDRVATSGGRASWTFTQPGSVITHNSRQAQITVTAGAAPGMTRRAAYTIRFGALDLSVEPREAAAGATVMVWVHSRPRVHVTLTVQPPGQRGITRGMATGASGWAHARYRVPPASHGATVRVSSTATMGGRSYTAQTTFQLA